MHAKDRQPGFPHDPKYPGNKPGVSVYAESDTEVLLPDCKLVVVGFNHRTADLAVRSRFAVAGEDLSRLTRSFTALPGVNACALVATCNRMEAYLEIRSEAEAEAAFVEILGRQDLEGRQTLARSLMVRADVDAARHLFRVTSGLDSMVLGDAQILGQVKQAYKDACAFGTASPILHKVFHGAFRCAKQVRSDTDIGGAQSVAGAGVSLLSDILGGLRKRKYLLVGVNKMTLTAGSRLCKSGAAHVMFTNRTDAKARKMARDLCGEHVPWAARMDAVARVDAIVTSTGAPEPIFTPEQLAEAVRGRQHLPLVVVDMAVPPDVAPAAEASADAPAGRDAAPTAARRDEPATPPAADPVADLVRVVNLEDIGAHQQEIQKRRCQAASEGENIVGRHLEEFARWHGNQQIGPRLKRFREEVDGILATELQRLPAHLAAKERERMTGFAEMLARRFMAAYKRVDEGDGTR
jgi:glutamyl-tRNA reductase